MLTLLVGTDWIANRDYIFDMLKNDVREKRHNVLLLVPELISHDSERRLCAVAGDTSSRFAEVMSFSRLTRRICEWAGCGMQECLDNGGRLVAMASAVRMLHSRLKAYASVETNPEFLSELVDAVDEFKRCCISSADLSAASGQTEGAFSQKLEELALIIEAYDAICQQGKHDPRDQLTWGLEQLQECDFAQNHSFYIDGFPDFTVQNLAVISHLIEYAPNVVISMHCDKPGSDLLAFSKAGGTASQLLRIADRAGVSVDIRFVQPRKSRFTPVYERLFQGRVAALESCKNRLLTVRADGVYEESVLAAEQILTCVHNGARYRDICVVCADVPTYKNALTMQFEMCGIPAYFAGTEDILEKSVISTVLTALDAALGGFEIRDILRYLKSALSPLSLDACDRLESYAVLWNITGKKWLETWKMHPEGLQDDWSQDDVSNLDELNDLRTLSLEPLHRLSLAFHNAKTVGEQIRAVYCFFEEIQLQNRLEILANELDAAGDNRNAQIMNQLWDILLSALEQMDAVLGQTYWGNESFVRLLKLLLSQYDVGTIPPVLDSVTVGSTSAMRCQETKHLIVVGAAEGTFPAYGSCTGVLSEQERNALRRMGIPLTGGATEGLEIAFSEIFSIFCSASETIYISCPNGQESFVYRRLSEMAGGDYIPQNILGAAAVNPSEAAAYLCRRRDEKSAEELDLREEYIVAAGKRSHELGEVSAAGIQGIYGRKLNLSASQLDKQADCRLSYFLKYGLRAKEQKSVAIDPAEFGTYVHAVLEQTAREICAMGGFRQISLQQTIEIARKYAAAYTEQHFSQIDSERIAYLFQRNNTELMMIVEELWKELQDSAFQPVGFEVAFGDQAEMPAVPIPGETMDAQLRGFVDRVDSWQENGQNYYRVVDYKTGRKDFDYCDVFNGLGLQMLLYLFALENESEELLGSNPVPAGVQYFPARVPVISSDYELSDEEAAQEHLSHWKRKGLVLNEDDVLFAMENSDHPVRLSCKRKKDGTVTGDIASREQFKLLNRYVFRLLGKMVDDIASGNVTPNPYTRGSSHNACRFCPYGAVCHAASVADRRNYKTMSSNRFWDEITKEMNQHE